MQKRHCIALSKSLQEWRNIWKWQYFVAGGVCEGSTFCFIIASSLANTLTGRYVPRERSGTTRGYNPKYRARYNVCEDTCQTICLTDFYCNCCTCKSGFYGLVCKTSSLKPQEALYLLVKEERYRSLFYMPLYTIHTICWRYWYRLQIKCD
jgi:hypothetical protein